jgi:hypothetical protein
MASNFCVIRLLSASVSLSCGSASKVSSENSLLRSLKMRVLVNFFQVWKYFLRV